MPATAEIAKAAKSREAAAKKVVEIMNLAGTYFEDGAWLTAADRMEKAAQLLREGHAAFQAALNQVPA